MAAEYSVELTDPVTACKMRKGKKGKE